MNFEIVILHLWLIRGISPTSIDCLIKHPKLSIDIYHYTAAEIVEIFGLSKDLAQKIVAGLQDQTFLHRELNLLDQHNISWMAWTDPAYPLLLKHINLPPPVIYWQGVFPATNYTPLAIVGARKADDYAQRVINTLVPELIAHHVSIISGGALGADAFAHRAAVQAGGYTVAVLGSGLLKKYPYQNKMLFEQIVEAGGALVSTFALEAEPIAHHFPIRNRIIAGLSRGCLVIQAAAQSGASITAGFSLDQGKDVFAIPGSLDNPLSIGCHRLIQQGAKLVTSVEDILFEFGIDHQKNEQKIDSAGLQQSLINTSNNRLPSLEVVQNVANKKGFSGAQQNLIVACYKPQSVDELVATTGLAIVDLQNILFCLQMDDVVHQDAQGLWRLNHDFFGR